MTKLTQAQKKHLEDIQPWLSPAVLMVPKDDKAKVLTVVRFVYPHDPDYLKWAAHPDTLRGTFKAKEQAA